DLFLGSGCRFTVLASGGLDDHAITDGLGADLDAHDAPFYDGSHLLNVRLELAGRDPRHLGSDSAKILGLAVVGDLVPHCGFLPGSIPLAPTSFPGWWLSNWRTSSLIRPRRSGSGWRALPSGFMKRTMISMRCGRSLCRRCRRWIDPIGSPISTRKSSCRFSL